MSDVILCSVSGCCKPKHSYIYCNLHYARYKRHGNPLAGRAYQTGIRKHPSYGRWDAMVQRCTNPNNKWYCNYGGRGITVCERWLDPRNFIEDMGKPPFDGATLERRDNALGYSPDNCVWADRQTQTANRRATKLNWDKVFQIRKLIESGVPLTNIAELYGVSPCTISNIKANRVWQS